MKCDEDQENGEEVLGSADPPDEDRPLAEPGSQEACYDSGPLPCEARSEHDNEHDHDPDAEQVDQVAQQGVPRRKPLKNPEIDLPGQWSVEDVVRIREEMRPTRKLGSTQKIVVIEHVGETQPGGTKNDRCKGRERVRNGSSKGGPRCVITHSWSVPVEPSQVTRWVEGRSANSIPARAPIGLAPPWLWYVAHYEPSGLRISVRCQSCGGSPLRPQKSRSLQSLSSFDCGATENLI